DSPSLPPLDPAARAVLLGETVQIDGSTNHADFVRADAVIPGEVPSNHVAVDDDQWPPPAEILPPFQQSERPVGRVELLDPTHDTAGQWIAVLAQVVLHRGDVQSALRIEHVLAPRLVEADGYVVAGGWGGAGAGGGEAPRPQEARTGRRRQPMESQLRRQRGFVPAAGVQVDVVPVGGETAGQVTDVRLAAAPRRQHAFV